MSVAAACRSAALVVALASLGVLAALLPASLASAAVPKPVLGLAGPSGSVMVNTVATLKATATGVAVGETVTLQKYTGNGLTAAWSATSTAAYVSGGVSFSVTPTAAGTARYRATVAAIAAHAAGTSPEYGLVATVPTPVLVLKGPSSPVANTAAVLRATASAIPDGEVITLQTYSGSGLSAGWKTAAEAPYRTADGEARFSVTPTAAGTSRYRVTVAATAAHAKATSAEYSLVTVTSAPPPPEPPAPSCGAQVLKTGGAPWACTFSDEFNDTTLDRAKWVPQTNYANGSASVYACYIDDPAVVSESGGTLKLSVVKMPANVDCPEGRADVRYAAGQVSTFYKWSQKFGRFEARMKSAVATQTSLHDVFWLYPDWRYETQYSEIDVFESYGRYPNLSVPYLHYNGAGPAPYDGTNSAVANTAHDCASNKSEWNTHTLEWDAARLEIKVNGKTCLVNTSGDVNLNKRYIAALTSMIDNDATSYADIDAGPKETEVDYIHVWS